MQKLRRKKMNWFEELKNGNFVIGMVHLDALPGTANFKNNMPEIYKKGIEDALALQNGGVNAIMIENFADMPYSETLDLSQSVALSAVSAVIKSKTKIPIGIDAAFNDYKSALSIAKAIDADFVRIPVFVDTVDSFIGIIKPVCDKAIKYRKMLNAENIKIFADIQVKYTSRITEQSIEGSANMAISCGADAVIVTGSHTGGETPLESIKRVRNAIKSPVIIGSGFNNQNAKEQFKYAHGAIVGTSLKTENKIDLEKVNELMKIIKK
jgi:hypothetical protein